MGYYGFYIFGTVGFGLIAYVLIKGSINMQNRSDQSDRTPFRGNYEALVAKGMFIGGIIAICGMVQIHTQAPLQLNEQK